MTDSTPPPRFALEGTITINTAGPVNTSGAFCDLFPGTHPIAGKVALKKPRGTLCTDALMRLIEIEAGVWIKLNHPRILKFLGLYTVDEVIYFVSPFAEFGSLPSYLMRFPDADRGRLIVEIAEGLAYLHQFEPGIIHGDVKGHNVLIASDHHAQLCDFGLARHADARTATALKGAGSLPWQSPEILGDGVSKSLQSDVYAFGITIYEVLSGKVPYCDCPTPGNIIKGVLFSNLRPPLEPPAAPDGTPYLRFWSEATKCWADNPAERPSMADVLRALSIPIVVPETVTSQPSIRKGSHEDVSSLVRTGLVGGSRVPTSFQADVISVPKRKAEAVDTSTLRASERRRSLLGQTTAPPSPPRRSLASAAVMDIVIKADKELSVSKSKAEVEQAIVNPYERAGPRTPMTSWRKPAPLPKAKPNLPSSSQAIANSLPTATSSASPFHRSTLLSLVVEPTEPKRIGRSPSLGPYLNLYTPKIPSPLRLMTMPEEDDLVEDV